MDKPNLAMLDPQLFPLEPDDRRKLEAVLAEFDQSWAQGLLAQRLRELPPGESALRRALLIGLVRIDLHHRWKKGDAFRLESYLQIYRELGTEATVPAVLVQAEFEARLRARAPADLMDFAQRFPRQTEELRPWMLQTLEMRDSGNAPAAPDHGTHPGAATTPSTHKPANLIGDLPDRFGRYRIVKRLGRGGMGTVYHAQDEKLGRAVALKVPHFAPGESPELLERFEREAHAAAKFDHPNLCPIYEFGELDGVYYLTMPMIKGHSLSELLQGSQGMDQRTAATIVRKLALALQEAHDSHVIHRDMKPSNVMMNHRGEPVIMDFGLARHGQGDSRLTQEGAIVGTFAYMAPEQMEGDPKRVTSACDIYSLGVMFYEMLTGRLPFDAPHAAAIIHQVLSVQPERPSRYRRNLDARLDAICQKAMGKKPADRYASMKEMAAALDAFLNDFAPASQAIPAIPLTPGGRPGDDILEVIPARPEDLPEAMPVRPTGGAGRIGSRRTGVEPRPPMDARHPVRDTQPGHRRPGVRAPSTAKMRSPDSFPSGPAGPPRRKQNLIWIPILVGVISLLAVAAVIATFVMIIALDAANPTTSSRSIPYSTTKF